MMGRDEVPPSGDPQRGRLGLLPIDLRHPLIWAGLTVQVLALIVLAFVGSDWFPDAATAPAWTNLPGAATGLAPMGGALLSTRARIDPATGVRRPWLRRFAVLVAPAGIGLALVVAALFTDGTTWPSVLVITAGLGTTGLALAALLLVVGPLALVEDLAGRGTTRLDRAAAGGLLPLIVAVATAYAFVAPLEWTDHRTDFLTGTVLLVVGAIEPVTAWAGWGYRVLVTALAVALVRTALVSRRRARDTDATRE